MNIGIRGKLLASFACIVLMAIVAGGAGLYELNGVNALGSSMYDDRAVPLRDLGEARSLLGDIDSQIQRAITDRAPDHAAGYVAAAEKDATGMDALITAYEQTYLVEDEKRGLVAYHANWKQYQGAFRAVLAAANTGDVAGATARYFEAAAPLYAKVDGDLAQLVTVNDHEAKQLDDEIDEAYQRALLIVLGVVGVAAVAGTALGLVLSGSIAGAARQAAHAAHNLAQGDVEQSIDVRSKDELGQMAEAFREMIAYQREMAVVAQALADGDLTRSIEPKSDRDTLGQAFRDMVENLRDLIGQVQSSAEGLADTSSQLGQAANQTSDVVQQVTQAVQNMAAASQETGQSTQTSREATGQLGQVIDGVARGASSQAQHIQQVSTTATEMAAGVDQVASDAQTVATASEQTRASAELGAQAVRETVASMTEINRVVADAAEKVADLGKLGEKIGAVVETIDDIAEQTNLLALNAAIEAARAGEHGRGFAIVADEVRKLAERSQRETKAISELIRDVQDGTRQAVGAMATGSSRVEQGSLKADEAGRALGEIQRAVGATVGQVAQIAESARAMAGAAHEVVGAMSSVGAMVEESSAAAEEMAAQASQVTTAIASIAAVAAENSAATEQVSASAEEMSAQVEEMSAQAEELAATADQLRALVARFQLAQAAEATHPLVQRRRQGDWSPAAGERGRRGSAPAANAAGGSQARMR